MADSASEKTEQATPKRKQDERKKGNVFLSKELVTVATLLATFLILQLMFPTISQIFQSSIRDFMQLSVDVVEVKPETLRELFLRTIPIFLITAMPIVMGCVVAAAVATLVQTKLLFSAKLFAFKANRLSPLQGIKRVFSMRGLVELLKSILKVVLLLAVAWNVLSDWVQALPKMMDMTVDQAMLNIWDTAYNMVLKVALIFLVLAVGDYFFQWWSYNKQLRMTKQEVKEEYKQTEGDPKIKGKIKERQQAVARRRMIQNVPNADVIIRNPTHYAVAIQYDAKKNNAPMVTAKGMDSLALRIVKIAEENHVYVMENVELARALYAGVDLEREIPEKYYKAVAEVLAFVYRLKKKDLKQ